MKVRVIADFDAYTRGAVFDWDAGFAELLIQRGLIERVEVADEAEESDVEQAAVTDRPERKKK